MSMSVYRHFIQPMYIDMNAAAPPAELARMIIGDVLYQLDADGAPRLRLIEERHAVWMVDKFALRQTGAVSWGQNFDVDIKPRRERGVRVYYTAELLADGKSVGEAEIAFFAVEYSERRILRMSEIGDMWLAPAETAKPMPKAMWRGEMSLAAAEHVRPSDCDTNRHLTSPKYLDLVCDVTGYWDEAPKLCEYMQIDYVSESRPGSELRLYTGADSGSVYVRGEHSDGRTAFDAVCRYREI